MEQRANHIHGVDNKEFVASTDKYKEKCHSKSVNVSCQSNPMTNANVSSLHYLDHKGVCSSLNLVSLTTWNGSCLGRKEWY